MGATNAMEDGGGVGKVTVSNKSVNSAVKTLTDIKKYLSDDHKKNVAAVNAMCMDWRSSIGQSATAFFYANATLIAYSKYCIDTIGRAKYTMKDYYDDMEIIDQDLEAMNFISPSGSGEGE